MAVTLNQIVDWYGKNPDASTSEIARMKQAHGITGQQALDAWKQFSGNFGIIGPRKYNPLGARVASVFAPTAGTAYKAMRETNILPAETGAASQVLARAFGPGEDKTHGWTTRAIRSVDPYAGLGTRNGVQQAWDPTGTEFGPAGEMAPGVAPGGLRNVSYDSLGGFRAPPGGDPAEVNVGYGQTPTLQGGGSYGTGQASYGTPGTSPGTSQTPDMVTQWVNQILETDLPSANAGAGGLMTRGAGVQPGAPYPITNYGQDGGATTGDINQGSIIESGTPPFGPEGQYAPWAARTTGYAPVTAEATGYQAPQRDMSEGEFVENRIAELVESNHPLVEAARKRAMEEMNSRGLLNSSMAGAAAQRAAIEAALPIAQQDASQMFQQGVANQQLEDQSRQFGAKERNTFAIANQNAVNTALRDFALSKTDQSKANMEGILRYELGKLNAALQREGDDITRQNYLDGQLTSLIDMGFDNGIFSDAGLAQTFFDTIASLYPGLGLQVTNILANQAADTVQ